MYRVKSANKLDSYHYHGSTFIYEWEIHTYNGYSLDLETLVDYEEYQLIDCEILINDELFELVK